MSAGFGLVSNKIQTAKSKAKAREVGGGTTTLGYNSYKYNLFQSHSLPWKRESISEISCQKNY
jgi:hypothetical protein